MAKVDQSQSVEPSLRSDPPRPDFDAEARSFTTSVDRETFEHDGWRPLASDADDGFAPPDAGLGPAGWRRSDARLADHIREHLMADRILDAREIAVAVDHGVVTLMGWVRHASDVRLAELLTDEAVRELLESGAEIRNRLSWPTVG